MTVPTNADMLDRIDTIIYEARTNYASAPTEMLAESWLLEALLKVRDLLNDTWPPEPDASVHDNDFTAEIPF